MQTKPERASILDIFADDLLSWESRITALSARTNDDVELQCYSDIGKALDSLRGYAESSSDYLREKPMQFTRDVVMKSEEIPS